MTKFMVTVRGVSQNAFTGTIGPIRYLAVPDGAAPAPSHQINRTDWRDQILATLGQDSGGNRIGDVLFLVHGFNVDSTNASALHDKVAAGLKDRFTCTIVSFDWPSAGETFAYLPDLDTAKKTAILLVNAAIKPLLTVEAAQGGTCRVATHVLCHSMGAYVVREAFDHADDGTLTGSDWAVNQLVLVAADVEASDFVPGNKDTESLLGHCYRLTNYFNRYDEVLQISNVKRIGIKPRAGRVGLPPNAPEKTVNVDASTQFETIRNATAGPETTLLLSHGWYFSDDIFFSDLAQTLKGGFDRTVIPGRVNIPGSSTQLLRATPAAS